MDTAQWGTAVYKTVLFVFAALGAAASYAKVREWRTSRGGLVATVLYHEFLLPPTVLDTISQFGGYNSILRDGADSSVLDELQGQLTNKYLTGRLFEGLERHLRTKFSAIEYVSMIHAVLSIDLKNAGQKKASGISLFLPEPALVRVKYSDGNVELREFSIRPAMSNMQVDISDLQPDAAAEITVWSTTWISVYTARNVKITHDSGRAKLFVRTPTADKYSKIEQIIEAIGPTTVFGILTGLVVGVLLAVLGK